MASNITRALMECKSGAGVGEEQLRVIDTVGVKSTLSKEYLVPVFHFPLENNNLSSKTQILSYFCTRTDH